MENNERLDGLAVGWLVDCLVADAKNQKVRKLSDVLEGKMENYLTMRELLNLNTVTRLIAENVVDSK